MITTSDQLFCSGNHFTDVLCTLEGVGIQRHLLSMLLPPSSFFLSQRFFSHPSFAFKAKLINTNGALVESKYFLYYDSTVRDYSEDHLPFAIVSFFIALVFVVLPTFLLIMYATRVFRKWI